MRHPESFKPASIANKPSEIQIVDTHDTLGIRVSIDFAASSHQLNRTLVIFFLGLISPGGAGRNRVLSKRDFLELRVSLPSLAVGWTPFFDGFRARIS